MRTIHEVSWLAGVSIRTLQYYDKIGLLTPSAHTASGYRLYDDTDIEKLQQILLFRELEFPLKEIREIMRNPDFDKLKALEQQITLLTLKKEHMENLIALACEIIMTGERTMDFTAFDTQKIDAYAAQAKASWGQTPEYRAFDEKNRNRTPEEQQEIFSRMMNLFVEFGAIQSREPGSEEAQALVRRLQNFITEHFYPCSDQILASLGEMYGCGGEFTRNINAAAGEGTAEFVSAAIRIYCQ